LDTTVVRSAARIDWLIFSARPGDIEVRDVAEIYYSSVRCFEVSDI